MAEVTVLMTVFNGMPYLPFAIESILRQTFSDFEFLIINDCSTDNTRDVILNYDDPRIRLIDNNENLGQTKSLNRGLEQAHDELVARMDADDVSHPRRLERQVDYLRKNQEVAVVGSNLRYIDPYGESIGESIRYQHDLGIRWKQLFGCPISCGAIAFRRSAIWNDLRGFNPAIRIAQDWELWSRLLPKYKAANISEFLLDVRIHPTQSGTISNNMRMEERKQIIKANPRGILGIADESEEWNKKLETLVTKPILYPGKRLEVVEMFFKRFSNMYPEARDDSEVLKELARQYMKVWQSTSIGSIPTALRVKRLMKHMPSEQQTPQLLISSVPWLHNTRSFLYAYFCRLKDRFGKW